MRQILYRCLNCGSPEATSQPFSRHECNREVRQNSPSQEAVPWQRQVYRAGSSGSSGAGATRWSALRDRLRWRRWTLALGDGWGSRVRSELLLGLAEPCLAEALAFAVGVDDAGRPPYEGPRRCSRPINRSSIAFICFWVACTLRRMALDVNTQLNMSFALAEPFRRMIPAMNSSTSSSPLPSTSKMLNNSSGLSVGMWRSS